MSETSTNAKAGQTPVDTGGTPQRPTSTGPARRAPGRRVGDVADSGLWPDLPRRDNADVRDVDIIIDAIRILHDRDNNSDYAVIKCADPDTGEEFTTLCGGTVVVEKLKKCLAENAFPLTATLTEVQPRPGKGGRPYYDIF